MPLAFFYGSLKQGFPNYHNNPGVRLPGQYRTCELLPMFLLGDGQVPCIILSPGTGHHVAGEVYEIKEDSIAAMDKLERIGAADGYMRVLIDVQPCQPSDKSTVSAYVYVKSVAQAASETRRIGPIPEYTLEQAKHFKW